MPKRKRKKDDKDDEFTKNDELPKNEEESKQLINVKYKGVSKSGERFKAQLQINDKRQYLGTFDTAKDAAQVYDSAAIQAGRPISKLNFLNQVPKNYIPKRKKLASTNTIGYRGVYKKRKRFLAQIRIHGKQQCLGTFNTSKEAAQAFDQAALHAKQSKSVLNFPDILHAVDTTCTTCSKSSSSSTSGGHVSREFPRIRTESS